jgi:hypothetical protein
MRIAEHIHSLQQHLAGLGLQPVPAADGPGDNDHSEVFKICFLNKYEMKKWRQLQETQTDPAADPTP